MRNARPSLAGQPPLCGGPAEEQYTLHQILTEAGLSAAICLDWFWDRLENPGVTR